MRTIDLHVKRLRETLRAIRHARHTAHAARTHLARAIRVAHAGVVRVNRAVAREVYLSDQDARVPSSELERITLDPSQLRDWQTELATALEECETITKRQLAKAERRAVSTKGRGRKR